jgi:hypothetical protein
MTFEDIKEQEPKARGRVEALRQAIKDAEALDNVLLTNGLKSQFLAAIEAHVSIFVEAVGLPFEQYYEIVSAMRGAIA